MLSAARDGGTTDQPGGPGDLESIFREHAEMMYRVAYRICGSAAEAEDVVQDVFVGLPDSLPGFEGRGSLAAWLRKVTARRTLQRARRWSRRSERSIEARDCVVEGGGDAALVRDRIEEALAKLPTKLRSVFLLKEAEGYSHDEIAEMLRIRPGTSEVRLHRAKKQLRELLGGSK